MLVKDLRREVIEGFDSALARIAESANNLTDAFVRKTTERNSDHFEERLCFIRSLVAHNMFKRMRQWSQLRIGQTTIRMASDDVEGPTHISFLGIDPQDFHVWVELSGDRVFDPSIKFLNQSFDRRFPGAFENRPRFVGGVTYKECRNQEFFYAPNQSLEWRLLLMEETILSWL